MPLNTCWCYGTGAKSAPKWMPLPPAASHNSIVSEYHR